MVMMLVFCWWISGQTQSSISLPPSFRSLSTAPPVDGVVSLVEMIVNEEDGGDRIRARDITTDSRQWRAHVFARLGTTAKTTNEIQTLQRSEFAEMKNRIRRLEDWIRVLQNAPARVVVRSTRLDPTRTRRGVEICEGNPDQGLDTRPATLMRNPNCWAFCGMSTRMGWVAESLQGSLLVQSMDSVKLSIAKGC